MQDWIESRDGSHQDLWSHIHGQTWQNNKPCTFLLLCWLSDRKQGWTRNNIHMVFCIVEPHKYFSDTSCFHESWVASCDHCKYVPTCGNIKIYGVSHGTRGYLILFILVHWYEIWNIIHVRELIHDCFQWYIVSWNKIGVFLINQVQNWITLHGRRWMKSHSWIINNDSMWQTILKIPLIWWNAICTWQRWV